jgi:DNA-binding SARP family transcriptional activator/DNA-binding beta-propeller fold protein YncE
MEFRILGPLEIVGEHGLVRLHRGKEQALLAFMLLHANELLPSERLIDELWERPPPTAAKILQNSVSQLRRALGDERIETRAPGYVFHLRPDELDVDRFETLAREGRNEEALALWRGPPLVELRDERFADDVRRQLEERRLAVLEDRIEADLDGGRHADLVPELERLVTTHPLQERLYAQLMVALYRSGRQAEALDVYRRAQTTLGEQLGLEPGPQLRRLERQILTQAPELEAKVGLTRRRIRRPRRRLLGVVAATALLVAALSFGLLHLLDSDARPIPRADSLVVIDGIKNAITHVASVGNTPRGVAVGPTGVWVGDALEGTVRWFDPETLKLIRTIGIGAQAYSIATGAGRVWITTTSDNTLVELDAQTGGILDTIVFPSGATPASAWAVTFGGGSVWATSGARLLRIDPGSGEIVSGHIGKPCCKRPTGVAYDSGSAWVTDRNELLQISANTGDIIGDVEREGSFDAVAAGFGRIWATLTHESQRDPAVLLVQPPGGVATLETRFPRPAIGFHTPLMIATGAGAVWIADYGERKVIKVDPNTSEVVARIRVGGHPWGIDVADGRVFVSVD